MWMNLPRLLNYLFFFFSHEDRFILHKSNIKFFQAKSTESTWRERRLVYQLLYQTGHSSTMHSNVGILPTDDSILVLFPGPGIHRPAHTLCPNSKGSFALNENEHEGDIAKNGTFTLKGGKINKTQFCIYCAMIKVVFVIQALYPMMAYLFKKVQQQVLSLWLLSGY